MANEPDERDEPGMDAEPDTDAGTDADRPTDDAAGHGAGAAGLDDDRGRPSAQLAERVGVGSAPSPAPPPRRTGVFLDPEDLRDHVGDLLRAMLGGYQVDAYGNFTFTHENARIFVTIGVSPVGPTVGVFSITNVDVEFTEELAAFLLTTNHTLGFGSFSYDPATQAVWLRHTLLGTMLDGPELQATLMAIASTAASVDDPIRDKFGGRAFHDVPADVQQQARPPDAESEPAGNASGYL